jgi:cytochrome c-type biogenesis protein CcmH/NrfG
VRRAYSDWAELMTELTEIDVLVEEARDRLRAGKGAKAIELLQQIVETDADCLKAHETLAAAHYRGSEFEKAIEHFQVVLRLDPRKKQADINIGAIYNRMGRFNDSVKALRRGIQKDRKCADGFYNLGLAYRGLNQLSMAVSAYREAIRLEPEMAEAHLNLANVFVEMGNHQQAILHYKKAIDFRPGFDRAERGLIQAEMARERAKDAISPFGRLVSEEQLAAAAIEKVPIREMSDQERLDDRHAVRQLSVDITADSALLLKCLQKELEPSLMALTRAAAQGDDSPTLLGNCLPDFQSALLNYRDLRTTLKRKMDQLRSHETFVAGEE